MKLLIISPNFKEPSAWMISAYKTAINLAKDIEVVVLTSQTKGSKKFEIIEGVKVYRSKALYIPDPFNYAFTPYIFRDLNRIIKKENPDKYLISKYMFFSSLTGIWLRMIGKRYVIQTDTFPGYCWFKEWKGMSIVLNIGMWIYTHTIGRLILGLADKVIVLYPKLVNIGKRFGLSKIKCIPNGVEFEEFSKARPAKDILKFKEDKLLITYLGRLDDVKGYKYALRLTKDLKDKVKFLFVCGNKWAERRKKLVVEYPYVKFLGFREDVASIFKASDIHILPSYVEGLPNSVMEAMACGCAVVASNVGGVSYIISNEKEGRLFKRNNYMDFKFQVLRLINNSQDLKDVKENSIKKIKKDFDWKVLSKKLLREVC